MKAQILINRGGGSVSETRAIERALDSAGISGTVRVIGGDELHEAAERVVEDGADLVIAGGGDGTISCVAGAVAGTDTRLGVLPLGTLNHFARDLGIPLSLDDAAKVIAAGRTRRVDVAELNGRVFINNSAVGVYPLMVSDREAQQERLGRTKRMAMAVAAARTLLRFSSRRLTLTVNDRKAQVDTPLLFVGNNRYRLELPGAGTRERLDSGELSVIVLRRKSRWGFCAATLRSLVGRDRPADIVQLDDVQTLRVDSARSSLTVSLDGETARMDTPLSYRVRPKALKVIAA
ncbi:MAG: diacylglycerol/lipid kinase family protein [Sphingomicrobium sp.]